MKKPSANRRRAVVGRPKAEKKLQNTLLRALKTSARDEKAKKILCTEVDSYQGVADVVSATYNGFATRFAKLPRRHLTGLNLTTARILATLEPRRRHTLLDLTATTGFSRSTLRTHLAHLHKLGFLRLSDDVVTLSHVPRLPLAEIAAYEVKVSDWRHGLYQAKNYRSFAHRVSLALPDLKAKTVLKNRKAFVQCGIGLAGISRNGIRWYIRPRPRLPISRSRAFAVCFEVLRRARFRGVKRYGN